MQEDSNPVKDYLFDYIKNSQIIQQLIVEKKFDKIIEDVMNNCYDRIISMGEKDEVVGILATGLLHYLLTNALITSQRKIEFQGIELDIIIPNIKTLEKDPKKTLLIYIPKSTNKNVIEEKISQLEKIQPKKENIWAVLSENISINKKSFVISKENNSFSKIIFEIAQFSNVEGTNKFKILRV
jgi:hypothetical protein